jgi:hypothetical protein
MAHGRHDEARYVARFELAKRRPTPLSRRSVRLLEAIFLIPHPRDNRAGPTRSVDYAALSEAGRTVLAARIGGRSPTRRRGIAGSVVRFRFWAPYPNLVSVLLGRGVDPDAYPGVRAADTLRISRLGCWGSRGVSRRNYPRDGP